MIYDTVKHAICENNGDVIAFFNKKTPAESAFKLVDAINGEGESSKLKRKIQYLEDEVRSLESELLDQE